MNISFITTVRHNVGDDFVREGIIYLLSGRWPDVPLTFQNIHKHMPVTVRKGFDWVRSWRISQLLDLLPSLAKDKIATADLLVLAGAPAYWCHDKKNHCAFSEWFHALMTKRYLRERTPVPFLILGVGTCQRYFSDGTEFERCEYCPGFIRQIHSLATVTTVRDALARSVLNHLGLDAPLLPCPSIFLREQFKMEPHTPDYICLNYMRGGGHYDLGQNIDADRWRTTFERFHARIARHHRCVLVCHNEEEIEEARRIAPHGELFYSTDYRDYIRIYSGARCGVVNRVHAAFAIASFGRPSFVVGADSRAHMVEEIGLRHAFVNDVTLDVLLEEFGRLDTEASSYGDIIAAVKQRARKHYVHVLKSASVLAQNVESASEVSR